MEESVLTDVINQSKNNGSVLVVLDCCYSGLEISLSYIIGCVIQVRDKYSILRIRGYVNVRQGGVIINSSDLQTIQRYGGGLRTREELKMKPSILVHVV